MNKSAHLCHYAAHYADVSHEISKVTSGYRLALIYSLCWKNGNDLNCKNINRKEYKSLVSKMSSYLNVLNDTNDNHYGILLDHSYTDFSLNSLGIKSLKGVDNERFSLLKHANDRLPEEKQMVFLPTHCNLTNQYYYEGGDDAQRSITYSDDEEDSNGSWQLEGRDASIEKWYDLEGKHPDCLSWKKDLTFFKRIIDPNSEPEHSVMSPQEMNGGDWQDYWGTHRKVHIAGYTGNAPGDKGI